jgi:hypothetical protein
MVATISAQVTSPLEGVIGVKLVHWYIVKVDKRDAYVG